MRHASGEQQAGSALLSQLCPDVCAENTPLGVLGGKKTGQGNLTYNEPTHLGSELANGNHWLLRGQFLRVHTQHVMSVYTRAWTQQGSQYI